jgi:hypothetical protein
MRWESSVYRHSNRALSYVYENRLNAKEVRLFLMKRSNMHRERYWPNYSFCKTGWIFSHIIFVFILGLLSDYCEILLGICLKKRPSEAQYLSVCIAFHIVYHRSDINVRFLYILCAIFVFVDNCIVASCFLHCCDGSHIHGGVTSWRIYGEQIYEWMKAVMPSTQQWCMSYKG